MILQEIDATKYDSSVISTNAYYDSFSAGKWFEYTKVEKISLVISYLGKYEITVYENYIHEGELKTNLIEKTVLGSKESAKWRFDVDNSIKGVVYFELKALDDAAQFYGASYEAEDKAPCINDVRIAINICTYNRDEYLRRNISLLRTAFVDNEQSDLYERLDIFITDNSNSERLLDLESEHVHVTRNNNLGGAGGFSRGLLSIMDKIKSQEKSFSHVIFMDDDIEINPECLLRTYRLLKMLRLEYSDAFIAGAMLRLDDQNILYENGARWNQGKCEFYHRGLDLRCFENVVRAEENVERDYAAWWYTCMPVSVARADNLPLPLFIHEDDVEYSLRNASDIITMNGIAVAHTVSEHRHISTNDYYNLRNMFIVNSVYCPKYSNQDMKRKIRNTLLMAFLRYRYKDMELITKAVEDYIKGPEWLAELDAAKYHKELQNIGYKLVDVSSLIKNSIDGTQNISWKYHGIREWIADGGVTFSKLCQLASLNGYFGFSTKSIHSFYMDVHPVDVYRASNIILYDDQDMKGIVLRRNRLKVFEFLYLWLKSIWLIERYGEAAKKAYRAGLPKLMTIDCWERLFGE